MVFTQRYASPLGGLLLAADEQGLIGLWFDGARHFAANLPEAREEKRTPVLDETARWLNDYFSGGQPDFTPPLHLIGSAFRLRVWARLLEIPYGQTTTYGALLGDGASARAVGGAVGRNPISILIPCHRVIGADGSLTGYAGGIGRKCALLTLEREGVVNAAEAIPQAAQQRSRMRQP